MLGQPLMLAQPATLASSLRWLPYGTLAPSLRSVIVARSSLSPRFARTSVSLRSPNRRVSQARPRSHTHFSRKLLPFVPTTLRLASSASLSHFHFTRKLVPFKARAHLLVRCSQARLRSLVFVRPSRQVLITPRSSGFFEPPAREAPRHPN